LLHAGKPTRFWDDATKNFCIEKVYLWASPDTHGKLETPHDYMQPAFVGTYKPVAVPFGSPVIAQLPREHRLVKHGSSGDRFIEGTYLYSDTAKSCIWMFSIAPNARSKRKISSHVLFNSLSKTRDVFCATRQQC